MIVGLALFGAFALAWLAWHWYNVWTWRRRADAWADRWRRIIEANGSWDATRWKRDADTS